MKINFLHITFFSNNHFWFSFSNKKFSDPNKEKLLIEVVKYVAEKGIIIQLRLMMIFRKNFDSYIEQLDAQKDFLQSDIRQFEKYKLN